ncbi:PKD domain-containing protein [Mucilaginibacter sp.]
MHKSFLRAAALFIFYTIFTALTAGNANAQTITVKDVDPGPFAPGSTITAHIFIDNSESGYIAQGNKFILYLSDVNGNFDSKTKIGEFDGFYTSFVNGTLPGNLAPGGNYKLRVDATIPVKASLPSTPFTVKAGDPLITTVYGDRINSNPSFAEIFGRCDHSDQAFNFFNGTPNATTTLKFINELTQSQEESTITLSPTFYAFPAKAANYTVIARSERNGIVATKSYLLLNNITSVQLGSVGKNSICLIDKKGDITIKTVPGEFTQNYPGDVYKINFGDGKSQSFTYWQLVAAKGLIPHTYTFSSCGLKESIGANAFKVEIQPSNTFCGDVGATSNVPVKVFEAPVNRIGVEGTSGFVRCLNSEVVFLNKSDPGQNPNSTNLSCLNDAARYTWVVDGKDIQTNSRIGEKFKYRFLTPGQHTITLNLQVDPTDKDATCTIATKTEIVYIQNTAQPDFDVPARICSSSIITPDDKKTVVDNSDPQFLSSYLWTVTGPAPVSYAGGTGNSSKAPQFKFTVPGIYTIKLSITTNGCGVTESAAKQIIVDGPPTATLSPDAKVCINKLTFNDANGPTKTTFSGTVQPEAETYTWSVTPGTFSFESGSNEHSQYPTIIFNEKNTTYTVTVIHTNSCGSTDLKTQKITVQNAPRVDAGTYDPVCNKEVEIELSRATADPGNSYEWSTKGTGKFSDKNKINTTYQFSDADKQAGKVTLSLKITTSLSGDCKEISSPAEIIILPQPKVTSSANPPATCSGQPLNYTITGNVPATFTWTAISPDGVTGFAASGSGTTIADVPVVTGTAAGTVIYQIKATANGCEGDPLLVTVKVNPLPKIKLVYASSEICSGQPAAISITSDIPGTKYTWNFETSSSAVTGGTAPTVQAEKTTITDVLSNSNNNASGTITYFVTPYNGDCAGAVEKITLTIKPSPVQPGVAQPLDRVCVAAGATGTYTLQGNNLTPATGVWSVVQPAASDVEFKNVNDPNTVVSKLIPGTAYIFQWQSNGVAGCSTNPATFNLVVNKQSVGGTTSTAVTTLCADQSDSEVKLTGYTGNIIRWESSTDNFGTQGTIKSIPSTAAIIPISPQTTTYYRAVVQNSSCDAVYSSVTVIKVMPGIGVVNAGKDQPLCKTTFTVLEAAENANPGEWIQDKNNPPGLRISSATQRRSQIDGFLPGSIYKFTWRVHGACMEKEDEVVVTTGSTITPDFKSGQTTGCGQTTISFTNTSFGNVTTPPAGAAFEWTVDGVVVSRDFNFTYPFAASATQDKTYRVALNIPSNCEPTEAKSVDIVISPAKPVASLALLAPATGCSPYTLSVAAATPNTGANNILYEYTLTDLSGVDKPVTISMQDNGEPAFAPLKNTGRGAKNYTLTLKVTDKCGNFSMSKPVTITVQPPGVNPIFTIKDQKAGYCIGDKITLQNGSAGGTSYSYSIVNKTTSVTYGPLPTITDEELLYEPPTPGDYVVTLYANSICNAKPVPSQELRFTVYALPEPSFTADKRTACSSLIVKFTNTTPGLNGRPASSLLYSWDFGDGTAPAKDYMPQHEYKQPGTYRVRIIVTNPVTGCNASFQSLENYIVVTAPPTADFSAEPGLTTAVPNYTFKFTDQSTGTPVSSWSWTFGDGKPADNSKNPTHIYDDPGKYKVRLVTTGANGCPSFAERTVEITGVRGELFIPNAFMPTSATSELRTFKAKGMGLKAYRLQIFNNYGQLIWESTQLTSDGAPAEGWDGTFRGSAVPQGVYVWQMSGTYISGSDWKGMSYNNEPPKHTGVIHLIR